MPINANTFNSRVTSEALEKKFRDVFPAQGGAELIQDLYAAGTIQPVIDFSSVAEGSVLSPDLQTAWDFSTGSSFARNTTATVANSPGFWLIGFTCIFGDGVPNSSNARLLISDGLSTKNLFKAENGIGTTTAISTFDDQFVVFLRSGDTVSISTSNTNITLDAWYRQIADVNGNLVNPLGFTFS